MKMLKRRNLLLSHILEKERTEDVFKAAGYAVTCGAVFRFFAMAAKEQSWYAVVMLLITFFALSTISIMYFAKYIAIPIDEAIQPEGVDWKNRYKEMKGFSKAFEFVKQKLLVQSKALYLAIALWYFIFGSEVGKLLANAVIPA